MEYPSTTCYGTISGRPLMAYDTEGEANQARAYQNSRFRRNLVSCACPRCGKWHLAPQGHGRANTQCLFCTGRDGSAKTAYPTREDAERACRGKREIRPYPCPTGSGWHLTRRG